MPGNPSPLLSLRRALASDSTGPSEVAAEAAHLANSNASGNTYLTLFAAESLQRAEQLPSLFPNPKSRPALYGVPISIKDCFDVAGSVTTCGSRFYAQHNSIATKNSWVAQRLLDSGAILTGKTHLHQLAYGITGENADYGDCVQPRDATLLTGGSSSGAAASVQEGSALAAIGTDTGGSIRVPAALCGLAGYRSSHGVSRGEERWAGGYHLAQTFDTIGLLFRDLRDAPDLADAIFDIAPVPAPATMRIGYAGDDFTHDCRPEVLDAYEAWKQQLTQHGASLSPFDTAFWSDSLEIYSSIQASEASAIHRGYYQHFEPAIAERLAWGASITAANWMSFASVLIDSAPKCRPSSNASISSSPPAPQSASSWPATTTPKTAKRYCATPPREPRWSSRDHPARRTRWRPSRHRCPTPGRSHAGRIFAGLRRPRFRRSRNNQSTACADANLQS